MNKWYKIENKSPEKAEIWIYEQIGEDFWTGEGITAKSFQKELSAIKASQIDLHINSPGGLVFDGITIYNLLKQHPANVTTYIDGLAASIASVIALSGDKVVMAENALFMVHRPQAMTIGDEDEHEKTMALLRKVGDSIAVAYTAKTGKTEEDIRAIMKAETWMSADQALEMGFIDEISGEVDMAACAKFAPVMQKAKFRNIPEQFQEKRKTPKARDVEKMLREAGCSATQAKAMIAEGFKSGQRDVDDSQETNLIGGQRDVDGHQAKCDRIADLLIRAEIIAPSLNL